MCTKRISIVVAMVCVMLFAGFMTTNAEAGWKKWKKWVPKEIRNPGQTLNKAIPNEVKNIAANVSKIEVTNESGRNLTLIIGSQEQLTAHKGELQNRVGVGERRTIKVIDPKTKAVLSNITSDNVVPGKSLRYRVDKDGKLHKK